MVSLLILFLDARNLIRFDIVADNCAFRLFNSTCITDGHQASNLKQVLFLNLLLVIRFFSYVCNINSVFAVTLKIVYGEVKLVIYSL